MDPLQIPALFGSLAKHPQHTRGGATTAVIGIGSAGRIVSVDLDADSPHILVNVSTGGGKSATLCTETDAREWVTTGKTADPGPAAVPTQAGPVQLQKPPASDVQPARRARRLPHRRLEHHGARTRAGPGRDFLTDAWSLKPPTPAANPGDSAADATTVSTSPANPAPVEDDQAVGLREVFENHLPGVARLYPVVLGGSHPYLSPVA
ncbi:hypothetical protein [Streptomyces sp. NPDC054834]